MIHRWENMRISSKGRALEWIVKDSTKKNYLMMRLIQNKKATS